MRQTCIFSGSSHPLLVESICDRLGSKAAKVDIRKFSNGETSVEIKTSVRDQDVFIVQSGSEKINDNVMEMLIMISACKGGSSRSITAVVPYFPYSRQSKKKSHRGAITARMLANLMKVAGVDHVITIDLHASQMQGFFKCPVDNLIAEPLLAKWIKREIKDWKNSVVVSKNPGGTKRVTSLADALKLSFGIVTTDRRRPHMPPSMFNSVVFDPMDGPAERKASDEEDGDKYVLPPPAQGSAPIEQDFAHRHRGLSVNSNGADGASSPTRPRGGSRTLTNMAPNTRSRLTNGDTPSSPLARSTRLDSIDSQDRPSPALRRLPTAPGITQPSHDMDGYEDSEGEEDTDERARDVITGRLVHGHIIDDDAPSPSMSVASGSFHQGQRHSSEDDPPDTMTQSFMSTASSHMPAVQGLGGSGDATHSDDEEEEALHNTGVETTITLVGNVRNKPVIIVDDMMDKASSWIAAAEHVVKRGGATKVYCMATHGLFGEDSLQQLDACAEIDAIIVTNSFPIPEEKKRGIKKLVELDVSGLLSEAIRRNHHGESISQLYQHFD